MPKLLLNNHVHICLATCHYLDLIAESINNPVSFIGNDSTTGTLKTSDPIKHMGAYSLKVKTKLHINLSLKCKTPNVQHTVKMALIILWVKNF